MLVVSGRLLASEQPRSGCIDSSQSVLLSGDEVEECEALLFGCLVESDEGLADGVDVFLGLV